jgi:hypothetical protein
MANPPAAPGPMSPGYDWGRILASLGPALSAAGSRGGWANFAPTLMNAQQAYRANERDNRQFQLLEEQAQRAQEQFAAQQRAANADAAEKERVSKAYLDFLGPGPMAPSMQTTSGAPAPGPMQGIPAPGPMQGGQVDLGGIASRPGPMRPDVPRSQPEQIRPFAGQDNDPAGGLVGSVQPQTFQPTDIRGTPQAPIPMGGQPQPQAPQQGGSIQIAGVTLNPNQVTMLRAMPPEQGMQILAQMALKEPDKVQPGSALGKLKADLDAGFIDRPTYDALVKKELAGPQGPGLTERQRNALAAGLVEGTPEYQQYILGRDDNEGGGPFEGTGLDNQSMNILLTGDPMSAEYAAAYAHLAMPRVTLDPQTNQLVTVSPNLGWASQPGQPRSGQSPQGGAPLPFMPGITGNRPGPTVQNAQPFGQSGGTSAAPTAPLASDGTQTMQTPGATITSRPGSGISAADRTKLRTVKAEAVSIRDALTRFRDVVKSSDWLADLSAAGGGMTEGGRRLNSAWTNAAIMTKAEALFNLGVLNGPDLSVIQGTLPNPSTMSGLFTTEGAAAAAVDEVLRLIDSKVAAYESQFGGGAQTEQPNAAGGTSGGTRVDQLPPGNWQ